MGGNCAVWGVRRHYIIVYVPETKSIIVYTGCREKVVKRTGAGRNTGGVRWNDLYQVREYQEIQRTVAVNGGASSATKVRSPLRDTTPYTTREIRSVTGPSGTAGY